MKRLPFVAFVFSALAAGSTPFASDAVIRFLSPPHNATVIGPTAIELSVEVPTSLTLDRVEVRIDGELLTTLFAPPWTTEWDAGDGSDGHRLSAVLHLAGGGVTLANIRTSALRINQFEEVGLVPIYPIVRQKGGGYVSDLSQQDFQILEEGVQQRITRFSAERKPLRIGIVVDTSQSMKEARRLENAQEAALEFLDVLEAGDEGMLVTFNDAVYVRQDLTSERTELADAIRDAEAKGGTALYDAIWRTSKQLEAFDGRRVLVLLSDGKDESYDGLEPGSLHTMDEALDQALRSEVMVFAIGLGRRFAKDLDFERQRTLKQILETLAGATGGRALISPGSGQLRRAFRLVAADLRNQYTMAYTSSDQKEDGGWRRIEVRVPGREVEVISRTGYFAGTPEGGRRGS